MPRFDVKSSRPIQGEEKYYPADMGIYFARNVDATLNYGPLLEKASYTYLLTLDPLPEGKGGVRHLNLMEMMARGDDLG